MPGEGGGGAGAIAPIVGFGFALEKIFGGGGAESHGPPVGSLTWIQNEAIRRYGLPVPGRVSPHARNVVYAQQSGPRTSTGLPGTPPPALPGQTPWLRYAELVWMLIERLGLFRRNQPRRGYTVWLNSFTGMPTTGSPMIDHWGSGPGLDVGDLYGPNSALCRMAGIGCGTPSAPSYPSFPTPGFPTMPYAPGLPALPGNGGAAPPMGAGGCIVPTPSLAQWTWPRTVEVAAGPGKILTYVRAPRVSYKVSISRRRRCSRGCR